MIRRILLALGCALIASAASARADEKLAFLIPGLYGPTGLVVDSQATLPNGQTHSAHFNSAFQAEFTQFNVALASQLTGLPIPTPASGFTYTLDPGLGLFTRSTRSFGPLLSDARMIIKMLGRLIDTFEQQRADADAQKRRPRDRPAPQ